MNKRRKNYLLGVSHGVFYFASNAFVDSTTVLPAFLRYLVSSNSVIGFAAAISRGGSMFFQLISAFYLQGRKKKPYLVASLWVRFLSWCMIALSSYFLLPNHPLLELWFFIFFLSLFSFAGGVALIPFYDIISYNIPSNLLGRFWAARQFIGGILAVASGFLVKLVLKHYPYPMSYVILFVLASLGFGLTSLSLGLMDEGEVVQKKNKSFTEFIKEAYFIIRDDSLLRRMVISEFFSHSVYMCLPFISIYALKVVGVPSSAIGYFISTQMIGSILSNLFWGYFADKKGAKFIILTTNILAFLVSVLSLISFNIYYLLIVYFVMGAYLHGSYIGYTNYLLKIAPEMKRPTYVSIRGTLNALSYFLPTVGGFVADKVSFYALFAISAALSLFSFIYSLSLKD